MSAGISIRKAKYLRLAIGLAAIVIALFLAFAYGWINGRSTADSDALTISNLRKQIESQQQEIAELRQANAIAQVDSEVSREALEQLRGKLVEWGELSTQQTVELAFYRSLIEPDSDESVFSVDKLEFQAGVELSSSSYQLLLVQRGRNQTLFQGELSITVYGLGEGGEQTQLSNEELGLTDSDLAVDFQFFQRLSGDLAVPKSFNPRSIRVSVSKSGLDEAIYTTSQPWPLKN